MQSNEIIREARKNGGFITSDQLPDLIHQERLLPLLVRCGSTRFVAAAQDVQHLIKLVEADGDYVRDVSLAQG